MRLFDLHCDTLTCCYERGETLHDNSCSVSLRKAERLFSSYAQVFAVFTPETVPESAAFVRATDLLCRARAELAESKRAVLGLSSADFSSDSQKVGKIALFSLENSLPLCHNKTQLARFYDLGVRMVSLTWNHANSFAGGSLEDTGLTAQGRQLLCELQSRRMLLDLSHLGDTAVRQALRRDSLAVLATHSNCRAVCAHPRNLPDDILRELIARRSLVGLNLYASFLSKRGEADYESVLQQIAHLCDLGGENCIAIGADFDGAAMLPCFDGLQSVPPLRDFLNRHGIGDDLCDRIFYRNAAEYFIRTL